MELTHALAPTELREPSRKIIPMKFEMLRTPLGTCRPCSVLLGVVIFREIGAVPPPPP